jgi:predicted MFS family arabinose efflux permease
MLSHIVFTFVILIASTLILRWHFTLPRNIWLLFLIQPLVMAASPVIVFIGGILSTKLTSNAELATLPVTIMIMGVASAAIPAALLAKKWGRKTATLIGFSMGLIATVLACIATQSASFELFVIASLFFGISTAFIQQLRFAAIESTKKADDIPKILSVLMLSGLFSAFLGPEIAVTARDWVSSPYGYTGSFVFLAILFIIAMILMLFFIDPESKNQQQQGHIRPLSSIIKQPIFIIALVAAAIGFALMSYLMTATPLSMHNIDGHSLQDTKWVIQTHIAAMYIPSLFTGWLVKKVGLHRLMLAGTSIYALMALIAFSGEQVVHYWWALLLLGVGWNFLFLTGTSLLPLSYQQSERHKVQALNDFVIFAVQAVASLLAGWVLFKTSWHSLVITSIPFIVLRFTVSMFYYKYQTKQNLTQQE